LPKKKPVNPLSIHAVHSTKEVPLPKPKPTSPIHLPSATLPPGTTLPVFQTPVATGDPTVTTNVTPPVATSIPIPTPSGDTPAATTGTIPSAASTMVGAAPTVNAPAVPAGFVPPAPKRGRRGYMPNQSELEALPGLVADLGNFANYATVLGSSAPEASAVQGAVSAGIEWRNARTLAEAWDGYVRAKDALAWKAAGTLLDELKPLFVHAAVKDVTLPAKYPALAAFVTVAKEQAEEAVVTRKKNAQTKAAAASAAATAAAAAATASAVAAAKAEAVAAGPLAKGVTVNA
jgi:hypothetical protein